MRYGARPTAAAGLLIAALTVIVWGTTFISTKLLLIDFTPIEILFFASSWATRRFPRASQAAENKGLAGGALFIAAGICGVTLYFLMENIALTFTWHPTWGCLFPWPRFLRRCFRTFC
jgi:hypothetical protein